MQTRVGAHTPPTAEIRVTGFLFSRVCLRLRLIPCPEGSPALRR